MIHGLTHASEERKFGVQSMLCMDCLTSKNKLSDSVDQTKARNHLPGMQSVAYKNKLLPPTVLPVSHSGYDGSSNVLSSTPLPTEVTGSQVIGSTKFFSTILLWNNSSSVEFQTQWEALHSLGPWITTPKTLRVKDSYVSEYKCVEKTCIAWMRLCSQEEGWFTPTVLE